jgi:hypothetical protein
MQFSSASCYFRPRNHLAFHDINFSRLMKKFFMLRLFLIHIYRVYFLISSNSVFYLPLFLFYHSIAILFKLYSICFLLSSPSFVPFQIECSVPIVSGILYMQLQQFCVSAAEKNLHITWRKHDSGAVNVTCKAQGVYPEPKMSLYMDNKNK